MLLKVLFSKSFYIYRPKLKILNIMLEKLKLEDVLFLDIETVPQYPDFNQLPENFKTLWARKTERLQPKEENDTAETLYPRAGIYAEFGKIICISAGYFSGKQFRVKSFYGDDERILLEDFSRTLNRSFNTPEKLLCAHNGKEFDFPYISRRLLINDLPLPKILNLQGKKPWEVPHLDTMELWRFGDYKQFTSLALLTAIFDIPSPKDDIDGSQVYHVYWNDKNLERIVKYCQKDTVSVAQILMRYMGLPLIKEENIVVV